MSDQVYTFTKSGSLVTIMGDPAPREKLVTVRRVDSGKEMTVSRAALVPYEPEPGGATFDGARLDAHAGRVARDLVTRWHLPADVAVRLAKGLAVTAEAVRVLDARGITLSELGMEYVARECFKLAREDDALPPPAGGGKQGIDSQGNDLPRREP